MFFIVLLVVVIMSSSLATSVTFLVLFVGSCQLLLGDGS